ncbi:MAG: peptidoglycan endopeptidase [Sphingomonas sp.]|uniref:peptidoglycan endopeptidase n=1 Tax=Sphingomonas sp. TaxID=28214 RepID=UPI0025FB4CE9|nr:peptidoglycan endopeptidase [Sphingomonas sp.]MBX3563120.1 peptidoglycan endopeptidase [Sphingomonas sp.]
MSAERARLAIGARFRPHGRDPATGLDCVGLAAWAFEARVPRDYALRSGDAARVCAVAAALGLVKADDRMAGDLLLLRMGPGLLHLAIDSGGGVIHADAMLRRVVERPGAIPGDVIGRWRKQGD